MKGFVGQMKQRITCSRMMVREKHEEDEKQNTYLNKPWSPWKTFKLYWNRHCCINKSHYTLHACMQLWCQESQKPKHHYVTYVCGVFSDVCVILHLHLFFPSSLSWWVAPVYSWKVIVVQVLNTIQNKQQLKVFAVKTVMAFQHIGNAAFGDAHGFYTWVSIIYSPYI